ncbi:MAG: DUF433 domain-containing protein [Chloroflexota bacterium]
MSQQLAPRIVIDPAVRFGRPVIEGTRVPVATIIAKLAGGMSEQQVCEEYEVTISDVRAALSYAASVLAAEEMREIA